MHAFCHAIPDTWHQMGVILSASDSLEWLSRITGRKAADLAAAVGKVEAPSDVTFLPYLSGERTPHNDAAARGAFVGLAQSNDTRDLTQAVLEGVAYAFADCQRVLKDAGTDFASALAVGGGARSEAWLRSSRACSTARSRSPPTATSARRSARRASRSAPPRAPTRPRSARRRRSCG